MNRWTVKLSRIVGGQVHWTWLERSNLSLFTSHKNFKSFSTVSLIKFNYEKMYMNICIWIKIYAYQNLFIIMFDIMIMLTKYAPQYGNG